MHPDHVSLSVMQYEAKQKKDKSPLFGKRNSTSAGSSSAAAADSTGTGTSSGSSSSSSVGAGTGAAPEPAAFLARGKLRYDGAHSEGNRFISNNDL